MFVGIQIRLLAAAAVCIGSCPGELHAQAKSKAAGKSKAPQAAAESASKAPAAPAAATEKKLEIFLLLPEPKAMRTGRSKPLPNSKHTVITAAREIAGPRGIETYGKDEFEKLGISLDTFIERGRAAADRKLAAAQPEFIRDAGGRIQYAAYRGDSPLNACLLMAPSLGAIFKNIFGDEVWAVLPDRHSLYIFPARPSALAEFTTDLQERYDSNPFAASGEIFLLKAGEPMPRAVGTFAD